MAVNNEIGVIQPLKEIGQLCRERKVFFHTDAAQAVGKIPIDVNAMNIDLLSISGHKIYGPKGVGALYVRRRPRVRIEAQMNGGGQERGLRSGTLPTPVVVGLGAACKIAKEEMGRDLAHVTKLSLRLYEGITARLQGVQVNGSLEHRWVQSTVHLSSTCGFVFYLWFCPLPVVLSVELHSLVLVSLFRSLITSEYNLYQCIRNASHAFLILLKGMYCFSDGQD